MIKCVILCFCVILLKSKAQKFPFNPCKLTDSDCLLNSGRVALPYLVAGIPELGVPSADPIILENVKGHTEVPLSFINIQVVGIKQCKMIKLESPQNQPFHLELECPITATGQYVIGGKVPVPAKGEGVFEIKTNKTKIIIDFVLNEVNGHWKIADYEPYFVPIDKFYIKLGSLFNGDKKRAEPVFRMLDNGWRDLVTEIGKPIILEVINKMVYGIAKFFEALPLNELKLN